MVRAGGPVDPIRLPAVRVGDLLLGAGTVLAEVSGGVSCGTDLERLAGECGSAEGGPGGGGG